MAEKKPSDSGKHRKQEDPDTQPVSREAQKVADSFLVAWPTTDPDAPAGGGK